MNKVKVSAVSYLNTKPFIYGIENSSVRDIIDLSLDIPSECARKLIQSEVDLGLVPVAVLPELKEYNIVSDYGICADGEVSTVSIFSELPLENIKQVYLDYQSRTSVLLTRILFADHWKVKPEFFTAQEGYIEKIKGNTAGLVIGDRAITLKGKFQHEYDLASAWKELTGLPFVFAVWAGNKELNPEFKRLFNEAIKYGVNHTELVAKKLNGIDPGFNISNYLKDIIHFELTPDKIKGMDQFLERIKKF